MRKYPTETTFRPTVIEAARRRGWRVHMIPDWFYRKAMADAKKKGWRGGYEWPDAGAPDLKLARHGEAVWIELKGEKEDLSEHQKNWIRDLRSAGETVVVVRPQNWDLYLEALEVGFQIYDLPDDWRDYEWT